jgi:hypothetical protein
MIFAGTFDEKDCHSGSGCSAVAFLGVHFADDCVRVVNGDWVWNVNLLSAGVWVKAGGNCSAKCCGNAVGKFVYVAVVPGSGDVLVEGDENLVECKYVYI